MYVCDFLGLHHNLWETNAMYCNPIYIYIYMYIYCDFIRFDRQPWDFMVRAMICPQVLRHLFAIWYGPFGNG